MMRQRETRRFVLRLLLATSAGGCLPLPDPGPSPTVGPSPSGQPSQHLEEGVAAVPRDTLRRDPVVRPWPMVFGPVEATPLPRPTQPATPQPPGEAADSAAIAAYIATADSAAAAAYLAALDSTAAGAGDSPDTTAVTMPQPAPPEIAVDLPPSSRMRMERTALRDIALADSLARRSALRTLPQVQRDKLETSLGLVQQARDALARGDVAGAANLAYKGRLIAEEVAGRR